MTKRLYNLQLNDFKKIFLVSLFFLPLIAFSEGLVPCGGPGNPCQLCHLFVLFNNIIRFLVINIVPPVAVLLIAIGGFLFFLYAENPAWIEKAKGIFKSVAIGLLLILSAWLIVNFFLTTIGIVSFDPKNWFKINCP
jgi:hypothetical protein